MKNFVKIILAMLVLGSVDVAPIKAADTEVPAVIVDGSAMDADNADGRAPAVKRAQPGDDRPNTGDADADDNTVEFNESDGEEDDESRDENNSNPKRRRTEATAEATLKPTESALDLATAPAMITALADVIIATLASGTIEPTTSNTALHTLLDKDATGQTLAYLCQTHRATITAYANTTNNRGETPLLKAILTGNLPAVQALLPVTDLKAGLIVDGQATHYAHIACTTQNQEIFTAVIEHLVASCPTPAEKTAALNLRDYRGNNVAQVAILMNAIPLLKILLMHPALAVTNINKAGDSLLTFTMKLAGDHASCIETLIDDQVLKQFPGLANAADRSGNRPLHYAAQTVHDSIYGRQAKPSEESFRTFKQLLTIADDATSNAIANLDFSARNLAGKTPLQMIGSQTIQTWIINKYQEKTPAIAEALRKSVQEVPSRCALM